MVLLRQRLVKADGPSFTSPSLHGDREIDSSTRTALLDSFLEGLFQMA